MENLYTVIDNFLPIPIANEFHRSFFRGEYKPSTVASNNPKWRRSQIMLNTERVRELFLPRIYSIPTEYLPFRKESHPLSEYATAELQVTRSGDGDFYRWHTDTGTRNTDHRQLTFVWFATGVPRSFIGGELRIYDQVGFSKPSPRTRYRDIAPIHNRLVLFHPSQLHEIITVHLPGDRWSEGRFTVNGWLGAERLEQLERCA